MGYILKISQVGGPKNKYKLEKVVDFLLHPLNREVSGLQDNRLNNHGFVLNRIVLSD